MKDPKQMILISQEQSLTYRDISFKYHYEGYKDPETGEEYETEEQYKANFDRIVTAYNISKQYNLDNTYNSALEFED